MRPAVDDPTTGIDAGDEGIDFHHYIDLLRRRWWVILGCGVLAVAGAWLTQDETDPVAVYSAEVLVQRVSNAGQFLETGLRAPSRVDLASEIRILRTNAVLGAVVDSLGLRLALSQRPEVRSRIFADVEISPDAASRAYTLERTGERVRLSSGGQEVASGTVGQDLVAPGVTLRLADVSVIPPGGLGLRVGSRRGAIDALDRSLVIEPIEQTNLIRIAYSDRDPILAADVANGMALSYQWRSAQRAREEARSRKAFIASRLEGVSDSLEAAQNELMAFQARSTSGNPGGEVQAISAAMADVRERIEELAERERRLTNLVIELQTDPAGTSQSLLFASDAVPAAQPLIQNLRRYREQRRDLIRIQRRTEDAPEVQLLDSLVVETREEILEVAEESLRLLRQEREDLRGEESRLRRQMGSAPEQGFAFSRLEQKVEAIQRSHDMLTSRFYEAQIAEAAQASDIEIIDPAVVPTRARMVGGSDRDLATAFGLGLFVGLALTLALDRLDTRVRRPEEVVKHARAEIVGTIPVLGVEKGATRPLVARNGAVAAEAFRMLRTNLRFVRTEAVEVIVVTSAGPKEGKSVISSNLALTLAQDGRKVLLVDADLRRPVLHGVFGEERKPGLSDILVGGPSSDAVRSIEDLGIDLLPAGSPVPNPAEIVGSKAFENFLRKAREAYDVVIIDTPPVLAVTDASVMGPLADGVILVARQNRTHRQALQNAGAQLRRSRASLLGVVVNSVDLKTRHYFGDAYGGYGYGTAEYLSDEEEPGRVKKTLRSLLEVLPF